MNEFPVKPDPNSLREMAEWAPDPTIRQALLDLADEFERTAKLDAVDSGERDENRESNPIRFRT